MPKVRTAGAQDLEFKVSPWHTKKEKVDSKTTYGSPDRVPFRKSPEDSHQVRIQVLYL